MKPRGEIFSVVAGADLIASRPIAGHANLCPGSISTKPQELETLLSTVKHEILHALGFSVSLYAFYRDENGEPRTPRRSDTGKPPLNEKYVFSLRTHPAKIRPRSPLARLCIEIPLLTRARAWKTLRSRQRSGLLRREIVRSMQKFSCIHAVDELFKFRFFPLRAQDFCIKEKKKQRNKSESLHFYRGD